MPRNKAARQQLFESPRAVLSAILDLIGPIARSSRMTWGILMRQS